MYAPSQNSLSVFQGHFHTGPYPWLCCCLIYTASQGNLIAGANANRWIRIPIVGLSFQTSTLASIALLLSYVAHLMSKDNPKLYRLKTSIRAPLAPCIPSCNITDFAGQFIYLGSTAVLYRPHFGLSGWIPHQVPAGYVGLWVSVNGPAFCVGRQGLSRLGSQPD